MRTLTVTEAHSHGREADGWTISSSPDAADPVIEGHSKGVARGATICELDEGEERHPRRLPSREKATQGNEHVRKSDARKLT